MASTSDGPRRAYVWVWLPGHTGPVFAGALELRKRQTVRSRSAQGGGPFDFEWQ